MVTDKEKCIDFRHQDKKNLNRKHAKKSLFYTVESQPFRMVDCRI